MFSSILTKKYTSPENILTPKKKKSIILKINIITIQKIFGSCSIEPHEWSFLSVKQARMKMREVELFQSHKVNWLWSKRSSISTSSPWCFRTLLTRAPHLFGSSGWGHEQPMVTGEKKICWGRAGKLGRCISAVHVTQNISVALRCQQPARDCASQIPVMLQDSRPSWCKPCCSTEIEKDLNLFVQALSSHGSDQTSFKGHF